MTSEELALKYIQKTERVFDKLKVTVASGGSDEANVKKVIEEAKRYMEDAKYYLTKKKSETSLASIAYCEGLLDALRMLRLIEFSW